MSLDTSPIMGHDFQTVDQIVRFADTHDLPPVMLLASGLQESQLNIWENTGDNGQSFGVFQIYTAVHGGPGSKWMGYDGLARSMERMGVDLYIDGKSRWNWAFDINGGWDRWIRDTVRMMYDVAPVMQGSIAWTMEQAHANISRAQAIYSLYQNRLIATGGTVTEPPPSRERELIDALTVTIRDIDEHRSAFKEIAAQTAEMEQRAAVRAAHLDELVASFGEGSGD